MIGLDDQLVALEGLLLWPLKNDAEALNRCSQS